MVGQEGGHHLEGVERVAVARGVDLGVEDAERGLVEVAADAREQVGLVGFFYPTQGGLPSGAFTSVYPDVVNPVITLNVFSGDLGIDDGTIVGATLAVGAWDSAVHLEAV